MADLQRVLPSIQLDRVSCQSFDDALGPILSKPARWWDFDAHEWRDRAPTFWTVSSMRRPFGQRLQAVEEMQNFLVENLPPSPFTVVYLGREINSTDESPVFTGEDGIARPTEAAFSQAWCTVVILEGHWMPDNQNLGLKPVEGA